MAENMDSGIQLNITTPNLTKNSARHERKKIFGNRSQRIKARRAEKKTKQRVLNEQKTTDQGQDNTEKSSVKLPSKHKLETGNPKLPTSFISSLFRHNPEVPVVKPANVKAAKEKVFSSQSFEDAGLHPHLVSHMVEKLKLTKMTQVQQESIPVILEGKDTLVKSQTGSGKTYAYGIPIVQKLQSHEPKISRSDGPYALVIVPTRELALQSLAALQQLVTAFVWIVPGCLMGGEKKKTEKARIRKGINILVATPGRLLDHIQHTESLSLNNVEWLVIDEADRLLEMGYEKDVKEVLNALNSVKSSRQTILLSATLTEAVEQLAVVALKNPEKIFITENQKRSMEDNGEQTIVPSVKGMSAFTLPEKLVQNFVVTPCKLRLVSLTGFVLGKFKQSEKRTKMIVFMSTKDLVEFHHRLFLQTLCRPQSDSMLSDGEEDWEVNSMIDLNLYKLHGDMDQQERSRVYREFCEIRSGLLFCTDVAARGLHLPQVQWIVHYTCASDVTGYVHRAGRTARIGTYGCSLVFLSPEEIGYVSVLNDHQIRTAQTPMSSLLSFLLPAVDQLPHSCYKQRQRPRTVEEAATCFQMHFENIVEKDKKMSELSRKAYQSYVRAYTTYSSSLKSVFRMKNLHLGHLAKSFALREAPSSISEHQKNQPRTDRRAGQKRKFPVQKRNKDISEFASGLDSINNFSKPKKKRKMKK